MKPCSLRMALVVLVATAHCMLAQDAPRALPEVISHQKPIYPALARQARIEGSVHLKIATDGHSVSSEAVVDGHPLLAQAAKDSVQTWKFADHMPGTFDVTFMYKLLLDKTTFLQEPGIVDVAVAPPYYNENGENRLDYTLPVSWDLELKNANDDIKSKLVTWTYGPSLQGYTISERNQERGLQNAHIEGDLLGFDAALDDSYGQRLRFYLIGKKTGDKIQGIFLDVWGASGTWTAVPAKPPEPLCAAASAAAQENVIAIPEITRHRQPDYPIIPWEAHIEGQVRIRVSTDSYCVAKVVSQSSEPLLAQAAEANVQTWWFSAHKPGTFDVTFNYRLLTPKVSFLERPGVVEILQVPPAVETSSSMADSSPETWKAELIRHGRRFRVRFLLPGGCCQVGLAVDAKGRREKFIEGHEDENHFGFSVVVRMANGNPTVISFIGKRTGNRIRGMFLDDTAVAGNWSAQAVPLQLPITRGLEGISNPDLNAFVERNDQQMRAVAFVGTK